MAIGAAALALGACGEGNGGEVEGPVTVYVSLPLTGPRSADGRDAADGARLALERAGGRAGEIEVRDRYLDDGRGRSFDLVATAANARRATSDSSAAAYIGELDSAPTRVSLPITNEAGLAQISPGASAVDLTRPAIGYEEAPAGYRPSGEVTFARVVPDDASQARAAAELANQLGATKFATVQDFSPEARLMRREFVERARELGLALTDALTYPGPQAIGNPAVTLEPEADVVYFAGAAGSLRGLIAASVPKPGQSLIASDAAALAGAYDPRTEGAGIVAAALDLSQLNAAGQRFAADFRERFHREPGPRAAYGYEAMALALDSISAAQGQADGFRGRVVEALLEADRTDSVLGPYRITRDGDTTLCRLQYAELLGGEPIPVETVCARYL